MTRAVVLIIKPIVFLSCRRRRRSSSCLSFLLSSNLFTTSQVTFLVRNFSLNVQMRITYAHMTDFSLDKIVLGLDHTKKLFYIICCKTSLLWAGKNAQHVQILLEKVQLLSTFCNNFSQPATTWFVARQVWFVVGKMRNIVIQLVLRQCCKSSCKSSWPFYRPLNKTTLKFAAKTKPSFLNTASFSKIFFELNNFSIDKDQLSKGMFTRTK